MRQAKYNKPSICYYNWRFRFVVFLVCLIFSVLIGRMLYLMVSQRQFLQKQGDARALRTIATPAYRGMLTDRNGQPLAISSPVDAIWVNPKIFTANSSQLKQLASALSTTTNVIERRIDNNKRRSFLYLKRQVPPYLSKQIDALKITGLFLQREYKRYYPEGEVVAHVVGFTNIDDIGQEGMELALNKSLQGSAGKRKVIKDRYGHVVENVNILQEPRAGKDIPLSLDMRIQYLAYRDLKATVEKFGAKAGSVVVIDTKTNEVLAMANMPSYNPNQRVTDSDGRYRNRAVTDVFEPGSTMKSFAVATALESGKYTPETIIKTSPGWMMVRGHTVKDTENHGTINISEVLKYSSNVGVSKIIMSLPPDRLWHLLNKVGLGAPTQSGFPGEVSGELPYHRHWDPFVLSTFSFGYGLSVTALQLASAYSVLANHGIKKPISLLKVEQPPKGERVLPDDVARQVVTMLESVVEPGGTATKAHVNGYWVAGKTGTSRIVGPRGYEWNHHNAAFVGMAPASRPRLVIAVYIHDPQKISYYGGIVAAPLFARVMRGALRILDIPPDHLPGQLQPK